MGDQMAKVIVGMTTSLDGFVNDRNGSVERLYADLEALRKTEFFARDGASTPISAGSSAVSAFCFSSLSRCRGSGCGWDSWSRPSRSRSRFRSPCCSR
jgi:hypothetical protein